MGRAIKFRGVAIANDKHSGIKIGDMVHGQFIKSGVDSPCIIWGDGNQIEIDIKTAGQFTGLTDKNGVDVYEGDLVEHFNGVHPVRWMDDFGSWDMSLYGSIVDQECGPYSCYDFEVVGNIHQHPELLEKGNE